MHRQTAIALDPTLTVEAVNRDENLIRIIAHGAQLGTCPSCHVISRRRHSRYSRVVQDLPIQGRVVEACLNLTRWRCQNRGCARATFSELVPDFIRPHARRSRRVGELVRLLGHAAGGRPTARLLRNLAFPAGKDTVLRSVKRKPGAAEEAHKLKIVGIDDWSWRKGWTYGTIMVDLESHVVVDILSDRSSATTAAWLRQHPGIEVICRDRCGVFAQGAREGAPQAKQVADRFHLMQNLRDSIERQMEQAGRVSVRARLSDAAAGLHPAPVVGGDSEPAPQPDQRTKMFERVHELRKHGLTMRAIAAETGVGWFTVTRWIREGALPERARRVVRRTSPLFFHDFLSHQWLTGNRIGEHLLQDIRHRCRATG